eukprot:scaffold110448_cov22-Tisochrysis_lutea.AAC.1
MAFLVPLWVIYLPPHPPITAAAACQTVSLALMIQRCPHILNEYIVSGCQDPLLFALVLALLALLCNCTGVCTPGTGVCTPGTSAFIPGLLHNCT